LEAGEETKTREGWKGSWNLLGTLRRRAPERKMIYAKICSLPYNKIKKQSNIISAKKAIAICTSYSINTAIPHPILPISTTVLIAPHLLPDKIFIIYRRHPDRRTHGSIPMCPSHSLCPCPRPRIFAEELGGVIFGCGWLWLGSCGTVVLSGKESSYVLCVCGCVGGRRIAPESASGGCCGGSTVV